MPMPEPPMPPTDGKPPKLGSCNPGSINTGGVKVRDYAAVRKLNNQIMVQALACGITRVGVMAAQLVHEGKFGNMTALKGNQIVPVCLEAATAKLKTVTPEWLKLSDDLL